MTYTNQSERINNLSKNQKFNLFQLDGISIYIFVFSLFYCFGLMRIKDPNIPSKYTAIFPFLLLLLYIVGRLDRIQMNKFDPIVTWLGLILPLIILCFGTTTGLVNIEETYSVYFLGDFYTFFQFIILGFAFSVKKIERYSSQIFCSFLIAIAIIWITEFLFSFYYYSHVDITAKAKFTPPNLLLFVASCWLLFSKRRVLFLPLVLIQLFLYAASGYRFSFVIALFLILWILSLNLRNLFKIKFMFIFITLFLTLFFFVNSIGPLRLKTLEYLSRPVSELMHTTSFKTHLYEGLDALEGLKKRSMGEFIFGKGNGALYQPGEKIDVASFLVSGAVTPKGIHHIHMSPFMFFFRYGLLGFLWYWVLFLFVFAKILIFSFRYVRRTGTSGNIRENDYLIICYFYLASLMLGSLMGNVFIYPHFPLTLYLASCLEKIIKKKDEGRF